MKSAKLSAAWPRIQRLIYATRTKNANAALKKLGQRIREGWAKKHPFSERSRHTVRTAVREVWDQEQKVKREREQKPPGKNRGKNKGVEPPEPGLGQ